ncbi:MAG TPA: glycosyltransferase family 4 protein [Solirubrobacteraceae bacterium]|jgi:glycosyltransferase involved in cell wall biosynthesis|nr:glycosyltransferase family 4 protein [Solirubrobacteraceae bacterium]
MSRVVLLSPFAPVREGRHGAVLAIRGLAAALAESHELVLVYPGPPQEIDPELERRCLEVVAAGARGRGPASLRLRRAGALLTGRTVWSADGGVRAMRAWAREQGHRFSPEVVQAEFTRLAAVALAVRGRPASVLTIHEPAAAQAHGSRAGDRWSDRAAHRLDVRATLREERRALAGVDAVAVFGDEDREIVARTTGPGRDVAVIPLATDLPEAALSATGADPPTLLFVGSFRHPPNVEAALRLGRSILPLVRAEQPQVTLDVVGAEPPPEVAALASDVVRVHGEVADLTDLTDRAAVVAAPIGSGGGTRVKVLHALAAGKAVVTTTRGAAGIAAPAGEAIALADDDEGFAAAVARLVADPRERERLGRNARSWAARELSWALMARRYGELYAAAAAAAARPR